MSAPAPFAALEAQLANAAITQLANAVAVVGAAEFPVVFDSEPSEALDGFANVEGPQAAALSSDVASLDHGDAITIDGTAYTVTAMRPDGPGVTVLQLRKA